MSFMFCGAPSFNQPLGDWKTGKVMMMGDMFKGGARPPSTSAAPNSKVNFRRSHPAALVVGREPPSDRGGFVRAVV